MRKQLKLLLLVATVVALFAMAMIVGSAATYEAGNATEFAEKYAIAEAGDTIKLTADISVADAIVIDKAITIDGTKTKEGDKVTETYTITYTGAAVTQAMSTVKSPDKRGVIATYGSTVFRVFADFTVQNVTLVYPHDNTTGGLFTLIKDVAFRAENVTANFNTFLFTASDANGVDDEANIDTVGGAKIDFVDCNLTFTGDGTAMIQYSHRCNPAYLKFTGCTINAHTANRVFKVEETTLTIHNCKIYAEAGAIHHCDTKATTVIITGSETVIRADYVTAANVAAQYLITFGEEGQTYDMDIQCTSYIAYVKKSAAGSGINVYSGTYKSSGTTYLFRVTGTAATETTDAVLPILNVKNATLISTNGARLFYSNIAISTTVENCEVVFTGVENPFETNVTATYQDTTFIVTARPVVYENQGTEEEPNMVPTDTPVALFSNASKFAGCVILAPGGTKLNSELAITPYAQTVKYQGDSYKIWYDLEGDLDTKTTTSIYVDVADPATSGIRFNTAVGLWDLVDNFAGDFGFDDTNIFEELDGYKVNFYTVVAPLDYVISAGAVFTTEALDGLDVEGAKYVKIQANNTLAFNEEDEVITYSGALINLKSYTRVYAAIAMVEVVEVESGEVQAVAYGNFATTANAHSAQEVAVAVQDDEWTVAQKAIVDAYASGVKA